MSTSKSKEEISKWLENSLEKNGFIGNFWLISNPRHSNQWFVDISHIQKYLSKLKEIFDDLIEFAYQGKNKSGSRSVLQKLMKQFPKEENSNLEDYIKGVDNLAKKLKSTSWLSFLRSFGASLNSKKFKDLMRNYCSKELALEVYNIKKYEKDIDRFSKSTMEWLKTFIGLDIARIVEHFNDSYVTHILHYYSWIFRSTTLKDLSISKIDQYKKLNTAWKPEKVPTNNINKAKEELTKRFKELQTIVKADTNHYRYSTEFVNLVDQLITHIESLSS